jgi:malate synthase
MKLLQISTLWLALFLVMGAGCEEQKQKSKERRQAIVDTVKDADKNINDAVLKMQENLPQLEEEEEVEADN